MTIETEKFPLSAKAVTYAEQVLSGDVLTCKWVRLACERFLRDLERAETDAFSYRWDTDKAEKVMRFAQKLPHVKGKWARKDPKTGKSQRLKLEPWQCFCLGNIFGWVKKTTGFRRFNRASIYIPRKAGKALELDTFIPTPKGWSTMGDLKEGDFVYAPDGTATRVKAVTEVMQGRPCYRVGFSNGETVIADAEHEWVTTARVNMPGVRKGRAFGELIRARTTREIERTLTYGARKDLNHSMPMPEPLVGGHDEELPIPPYTLGAWLGDGNTDQPQITLSKSDVEILEAINAEGIDTRAIPSIHARGLGNVGGWRLGPTKSRSPEDVKDRLRTRFVKAGLLGQKRIPKEYLRASKETRLALLQGLMDTDGTVCAQGKTFEFCSTLKGLAEDFCELLSTFGIKHSMCGVAMRCNGRPVGGTAYRIVFCTFRDQVPCFKLRRKLDRMRYSESGSRSRTVQIVSCEPVESVPVKCIQVAHPSHQYLFGKSMLPTHNSFLSCVIGWWMFAKDDEPGAEVYCGATTEGQAWEVFRPARQMGLVEPALPEGLGIEIFGNSMKKTDDGSRFEPVIGKPGDGASPHCAIVDEYHEHPDSVLYDTMKTGMGAREQALLLIISTAGDNLSGPCREDWRNCEKMLENAFEDETKFACIWTIDEGDDWANETAIAKANPNWGVSVNPDMVLPDLEEAKRDPAKQAVFKTKQLNLWVNAKNGWLNMEKWNACADASLRMEDFAGQPCWVGIDAAAKIDVFSVVAVFERDDHLVVFPRHFMPEETIALPHNKHMQKWVAQGFLTATPGARTDQMQVENILREWSGKYYIQEVAYDPKEISYLMNQVRTWAGFPCIEMTQGPTLISEPMKELEAKINTLKLRHTACPMLTWMASNVIKKEARGGGPVKYYYPAKEKDDRKIDGVVALIMALSRQMAQQGGAGVGFY